ncbi:hypothetical protein N431DRAFT_560661 [Stipitochalara longipes BDJ]|nr:hypothetical protein N431DRAFT_560661 [Stipitochalara longipes BDJ]
MNKDDSKGQPQLPPPTGQYKTGVLNIPVTDHSRKDLFSPTNDRILMLSIFYPTHEHDDFRDLKPYITPVVASLFEQQYGFPNGSLTTVLAHSKEGSTPFPLTSLKRLLFSHGGGTSRLIHTALLEDLASHGYIAISIDHPYDAAAVEFPDGSVIYRYPFTNFTSELLDLWYVQRLADIIFVDNVTNDLSILYHSKHNSSPPALAGHSFGGAAIAGVMIETSGKGFIGGFNFDGAFWNNSISGDAVDPFFIMGGPVRIPAGDTSWDTFRAAQTGWEREAIVNGTQHFGFTDFLSLVEVLELPKTAEVDALVGTLAANRALEIQRVYVRNFVSKVFGTGSGELVDGPSLRFPEVTFIP